VRSERGLETVHVESSIDEDGDPVRHRFREGSQLLRQRFQIERGRLVVRWRDTPNLPVDGGKELCIQDRRPDVEDKARRETAGAGTEGLNLVESGRWNDARQEHRDAVGHGSVRSDCRHARGVRHAAE
jgi:hypothetical protein